MQDPYYVKPNQMYAGRGEATKPTYTLYTGTSGCLWLVGDGDDPTDEIYCTDSTDPNKAGQGFAGATIEMQLVNGTTFLLKGGWHASTTGLLIDTGIDLTDKFWVKLTISRRVEYDDYGTPVMHGLVYQDEDFVQETHERRDKFPQQLSDQLNETLRVLVEGRKGWQSLGWVYPGGVRPVRRE